MGAETLGAQEAYPFHFLDPNGRVEPYQQFGLTKLEAAAIAAMQGYCAVHEGWSQPAEEVARCAVAMADALFAELARDRA